MSIKSPEDFHNKIGFIFHGILALPLAAFVYLFLEIRHRNLQPVLSAREYFNILIGIIGVLAVIIAVAGLNAFKKEKRMVNNREGLQNKLIAYYHALTKFYIYTGVSSVVFVGGLYLTASAVFIVGYVFLLFLLSLNRPSLQKYVNDLRLTKEERDIILHKGQFSDN